MSTNILTFFTKHPKKPSQKKAYKKNIQTKKANKLQYTKKIKQTNKIIQISHNVLLQNHSNMLKNLILHEIVLLV